MRRTSKSLGFSSTGGKQNRSRYQCRARRAYLPSLPALHWLTSFFGHKEQDPKTKDLQEPTPRQRGGNVKSTSKATTYQKFHVVDCILWVCSSCSVGDRICKERKKKVDHVGLAFVSVEIALDRDRSVCKLLLAGSRTALLEIVEAPKMPWNQP